MFFKKIFFIGHDQNIRMLFNPGDEWASFGAVKRSVGLLVPFQGSEFDEKRQLIKLVLSNLMLDSEKLFWQALKPFDLLLKCSDDQIWRG